MTCFSSTILYLGRRPIGTSPQPDWFPAISSMPCLSKPSLFLLLMSLFVLIYVIYVIFQAIPSLFIPPHLCPSGCPSPKLSPPYCIVRRSGATFNSFILLNSVALANRYR
uniref:Uncharacterized protein n=1 Tax=Picea sitchensis TaxID=3332 RepID=A0A6B9XRW0_PICSI|nr:hypothetical protein Q903MT_gene3705 [Picea sitchensis]